MLTVMKDQIILFFVQNTYRILYYTHLSSQEHFQGAPYLGAKTAVRAKLLVEGCGNQIHRNLEYHGSRCGSAGPGSRKWGTNRESSSGIAKGRYL